MKSLFAIAIVFLFSIQGRAGVILAGGGPSGQLQFETEFFLTVKSKCKASAFSYKCEGGIKFDEQKSYGWKKDPVLPNYYEYTGNVEPDLFQSHEDKRIAFLNKVCVSTHFEVQEMREIFTCTEKNTKQEIKFQVLMPGEGGNKGREGAYELMCDAAGGTNWLKQVYPKATWTESPKMPHYYITEAVTAEKGKELSEAIYQTIRNRPAGCRLMDCELGVPIPDGCEQKNP